jgi:hypothetical protein
MSQFVALLFKGEFTVYKYIICISNLENKYLKDIVAANVLGLAIGRYQAYNLLIC